LEKLRFQTTLRQLLGVFARAEHPLAIFLDDLQWLDAATLELLESLFLQPEQRHFLLVAAYRDDEVDGAHPLAKTVSTLRERVPTLQELELAPLDHEALVRWFADALGSETERLQPLAQLVHSRTAGNPFFARQFVQELV